jgi:S-formylglutathione hydrolase FrmB
MTNISGRVQDVYEQKTTTEKNNKQKQFKQAYGQLQMQKDTKCTKNEGHTHSHVSAQVHSIWQNRRRSAERKLD